LAARVWESNSQKHKEICDTMQPRAWGYNASTNGKHKSADDVMEMLANAEAAGANLLLNVGPLPDGSFPEEDIAALKEVGERLKAKIK
jgi:alpha-L-fucosidase